MFPSPSIDALSSLSREQLLERLSSSPEGISPQDVSNQISLQTTIGNHGANLASQGDRSGRGDTEALVDTDPDNQQDDESSEAGDDVNALSATSAQPSSYVGPSSTMQMFRTILRIAPEPLGQSNSSQSPTTSQQSGSLRSHEASHKTPPPFQMTEKNGALIDAYFNWVHPATPILDESNFRQTASSGARNDAPWLCLVNMVLALGSIGTTRTEPREHLTYYHAARSHLDLEGLGNKSLETLQALILMAGWYNHYRNRPNLASALLGAAFRMAYALGLHKEQHYSNDNVQRQQLRRQIWWNLVVLDAAEAVTLGRTLDTRIFETEVHTPRDTLTESPDSPSPASALIITIGFSRIMTEIQSRLMTATSLPFTESLSLDAHLVDWYEALPPYFHRLTTMGNATDPELSPATRFVQPLLTIKWRYLNLRMLLYRPSLMEAVLHRIPFSGLTSDQRLCIRKCLTLSGETIDSVKTRSSEPPNQYIAWPSTWYLLQICMIPLLSLYVFRDDTSEQGGSSTTSIQHGPFQHSSNASSQVRQIRDECHRQVQLTLGLMKEMEPWAVASGKMHDLIDHLYQARDQHLRVWNNTEESPVLVLGSPENSSTRQSESRNPRALEKSQTSTKINALQAASNTFQNDYAMAPPERTGAGAAIESHLSAGPPHNTSMNQFEQFSRDWSVYNSLAWPNATLESLFDLPDDFQYMDQDPFGVG